MSIPTRETFFRISTLIVLTTLVLYPLFSAAWYPMHDSTHPMRLTLLQETIALGQFPPIWAYHINQGYGYPLFHLYAPLYHFTSYAFSLVVTNALALKLGLLFYTFLGLWGVWKITARWGVAAAVLGVTVVAVSPYFALDLYVRGAYAEYVSLCLFPWVIYTTSRLKDRRSLVLAALATSGFLLSHNLIPVLAAPIVVLSLLSSKPTVKQVLLYLSLTLLLTAWFLGPLVYERHFTQAEQIAQTTAYQLHFVEPWQIWDSTWGFGGSAPGVEDGMSFKLGKLQLLLGLGGILLAFLRRANLTLLLALSLVFTLFFATPLSRWFWDNLPLLSLVQFPWRSLGLSVILLGILAAYGLTFVKFRVLRIFFSLTLSLALILLNQKYFRPQTVINYPTSFVDIARVVPEYLPRWMPTFPTQPSANGQVAYYPTWRASAGDELVPTAPDSHGILTYSYLGSAPITLTQGHTPLQRLSYVLTLLGLLLSFYLLKRPKII